MAEIIAIGAAAYLGWKAARRVHRAYNNAVEDMYAQQSPMGSYYPSGGYYSQPPPYSREAGSAYPHHRSGHSYNYR